VPIPPALAADKSRALQSDVIHMLTENGHCPGRGAQELAHDIIVVVRERVLTELASYARQNIR
jgi:hypothetical protein